MQPKDNSFSGDNLLRSLSEQHPWPFPGGYPGPDPSHPWYPFWAPNLALYQDVEPFFLSKS